PMAWAAPTGPHAAVVLSSRVRLARNLAGHPFPPRASARDRNAVLEEFFQAAAKTVALAKAAVLKLEDVAPVERLFLAERRLISQAAAGGPKNRGVAIGEREVVSALINEEDHLRLQAVDSGLCPESLWSKLTALDDELSRQLEYAYHSRWGYLTFCPTNVGTGLRASALLHLAGLAITGQIKEILGSLLRLGIIARGLYGEGTQVLGDFYQISNATSLGRTEAEILAGVAKTVENLVSREMEVRRSLADGKERTKLEDMVYRALGILAHARSISYEETLQHLSYIRLAVSLQWKLPAGLETVNQFLVLAQPAHVQVSAGREAAPAERDRLRADLLRDKFEASS
ncbi:MAG: protein arginine kinase, partial [Elusimicrobia bacterium]|nr:protein arginine kinase [Elusimicrobiota bacterium]